MNYIKKRRAMLTARRFGAKDAETKHDPANGQFTSGSGGGSSTSYNVAKTAKTNLEVAHKTAGEALNKFDAHRPPGIMGLIPDDIKASPEYKKARAEFEQAHTNLRNFNEKFLKQFAKEYAEERKARRK